MSTFVFKGSDPTFKWLSVEPLTQLTLLMLPFTDLSIFNQNQKNPKTIEILLILPILPFKGNRKGPPKALRFCGIQV